MGIISSNKSIGNIKSISCQGEVTVSLGITASPGLQTNPADIVLILDRSASMDGQSMTDLKVAAENFIDIISEATGGLPDDIGMGSQIGIVSFSDTAVQETGLITSVNDLKTAVTALESGGFSNHADAFTKARELLSGSANNKVILMFTDGASTTGANPSPVAASARAEGIAIYCIGLPGSGGTNVNALNDWATDPDITHVAVVTDNLSRLFTDLQANINKNGAVNIVIDEVVNPDFTIIGTPTATNGSISAVTQTSFQWSIGQLGVTETESAAVTFTIVHNAGTSGTKKINQTIDYSDDEDNEATFADPEIRIICEPEYQVDACREPVEVNITGCEDYVVFDAGDLPLEDNGRILQLDVNLMNVCPGKSIAMAVVLSEEDQYGTDKSRGTKFFTIPPHNLNHCSNILITCIRFILPDDMYEPCEDRFLKARFFAHYIDNGFTCCNPMLST